MITSKQRAALRGMANTMQPLYQIGKEGITPAVTAQLDDALEARELIKVTVLETADVSAKEAIEILAGRLRAKPNRCSASAARSCFTAARRRTQRSSFKPGLQAVPPPGSPVGARVLIHQASAPKLRQAAESSR